MTIIGEPIIGGDFIGDIIGGSHPRTKVYDFNGTTMYATMGTGWEPLGLPYSIEFKAITDDVTTAALAVSKDTAEGFGVLSGNADYGYDGVTNPNLTATSAGLSADTEYTYLVNATGGGTTVTVISAGTETEVAKIVGQGELTTIGASGVPDTFWGGPIWGLRLTDNSPLQGRSVMDIGNTRYVTLDNEILIAGAFEIELDAIRGNHTSDRGCLLGGNSVDTGITLMTRNSDGVPADQLELKTTTSTKNVDGALSNIAYGQHYTLKVTRDGSNNVSLFIDGGQVGTTTALAGSLSITTIGAAEGGALNQAGSIGNVRVTNTGSGDTWIYALEKIT